MTLVHYRAIEVEGEWRIDISGHQEGRYPSRADALRAAIKMASERRSKTQPRWKISSDCDFGLMQSRRSDST